MRNENLNQNQLSQTMRMSLSQIRDVKRSLLDNNIIIEEPGSGRAKILKPNIVKMHKLCNEYFSDVTDQKIPEEFVRNYIEIYCHYNKRSTLRDMLYEDLVVAFKTYCSTEEVEKDWVLNLCEDLDENAPHFPSASKYVSESL